MTRFGIGVLAAALLAACSPGAPSDPMTAVTVAGGITGGDRGAFDADQDKYFDWMGVTFDGARGFSRQELAAMPQHRLQAAPEALPPGVFEGPLLADVLERAGASRDSEAILAHAMDGYSAEIPMDAAREAGAIVALSRNGAPLSLGGAGPAMIVFPDAAQADPGWYVWALILITVE